MDKPQYRKILTAKVSINLAGQQIPLRLPPSVCLQQEARKEQLSNFSRMLKNSRETTISVRGVSKRVPLRYLEKWQRSKIGLKRKSPPMSQTQATGDLEGFLTVLQKNRPLKFDGFGPSILAQLTREKLESNPVPKDRLEARAMLHDRCPLSPGVYGWLDNRDQLCYVGKSKSLRKRLLSYFAKTPADKKALRIRQHSKTLVWEPISEELLSLIREQELIYRWRPEFNTQGQPVKRQPAFICISGGPAGNAYFTRRVTEKATHSFGPVAGTGRLRAAVDSINQVFQLRDCSDKTKFEFNNQQQLFENPQTAKCIRYELGSCPGPCAGNCSASDYKSNLNLAIKFIKGSDVSILKTMDQDMKAAASDQRFERATILRDHIDNLGWLNRRMKALRFAQRNFNGVLPIEARNNRMAWLVLKGGRLLGSAPEPKSPERALGAIKYLTNITRRRSLIPANIMEMNLQLIIMAWFRKNPAIKKTLIPFADAIATCEAMCDSSVHSTDQTPEKP
ncbi:MAG: GIY-YIG nuclease family protein [Mariniblastus sp.]